MITPIESPTSHVSPDQRVSWCTALHTLFKPLPTVRSERGFSLLRILSLASLFVSVRSQLFGATLDLSNLDGTNGFALNGENVDDRSGWSVAGIGDVNVDGVADFIIGAPFATPAAGREGAGKTYVVFGHASIGMGGALELSSLDGANGFVLNGEQKGDNGDGSGTSVTGTGDINGDGVADLVIGAPYSDPPPIGINGGKTYVVFGRKDLGGDGSFELSSLASPQGFVLIGTRMHEWTGFSVAGAGDVNADGIQDLVMGAHPGAGKIYVLFGSAGLSDSKSRPTLFSAFTLSGEKIEDHAGRAVAGAGDVNGDGIDDFLVGAWQADPDPTRNEAGKAYVIFGDRTLSGPSHRNLEDLKDVGLVLNGDQPNDRSGLSISRAGDVNADGIGDVIIGAPTTSTSGGRGKAYVVFGRRNLGAKEALELSNLNGVNGFAISGEKAGDHLGGSVSYAGDINGDGISDIAIGARDADSDAGRINSGKAYVIFGSSTIAENGTFDLAKLNGENGFVIHGEMRGDFTGASVANAGDVNGDGIDDFLIGAYGADPTTDRENAGKAYVVFGRNLTVTTSTRERIQTLPEFDSTVTHTATASTATHTKASSSTTAQPPNRRFSTSMRVLTQARDQSPIESGFGVPFAIAGGVCALVSSVASAVFIFRHRDRCGASSVGASEEAEHTVQDEDVNHRYTNLPAAPKYRGLELYPPGHSHYTPIDEVNRLHDEYESARLVRAQENYDDIPRGARS